MTAPESIVSTKLRQDVAPGSTLPVVGLRARSAWLAVMPGLFVILWSTGFIGAKYGLPYAEPFTYLAIRFWLVTALLATVAWLGGARWPRERGELTHLAIVGLLV